jgi:DNA-binding NarL/FixJ family response regulator
MTAFDLLEPATPETGAIATVTVEAGDPGWRSELAGLLWEMPFAVRESDGLEDVLGARPAPAPDVVVMGLVSTERNELRVVRAVHAALPAARIVVVATPARGHDARLVIGAGADALVVAADAPRTLAATVQAVLAGQVCVPRELRGHVEHAALSHRERQVLALMAGGATNRQIGETLYLTESTVKSHLATAFAKLGVRSRAEATLALEGEGWSA